jgi:hypothetical protein
MIEIRDTSGGLLHTVDSDDLHHLDYRGWNFRSANLSRLNLSNSNLEGADLSDADLTQTYAKTANFRGANFSRSLLSGACFLEANLQGADFTDALGAELAVALSKPFIVPQQGSFTGWKQCLGNVLVELEILDDARRTPDRRRECRAEAVKVLQVIGADVGFSAFGGVYRTGEIVRCDHWGPDVSNGPGGIYFFLSRAEAENR